MHVLIYLYSLSSGGAERVASGLADCWKEQGWDVTIVTIAPVSRDFYEVDPGVRRVAFELDIPSTGLLDALRNNWRRLNALRTALRELDPDIAVGLMPSANCTLFLAALGTSVPVVGCERTYPPAEPLGRAWRWLRRVLYRRFDVIVAQTERSADWIQRNCSPRKVAVIPNMVTFPLRSTLPHIPVPRRDEQAGRSKLLLSVGRLRPEKGFDRLIEAFAQLAPCFPDWRLCLLGEGPDREALMVLAERLGMASRISMPGAVGNMGDWYEAADLYVLTSLFEGFPNSLLEAMAYGLPAVSVDCDTGPRDIVRHGVDGILVPQDDSAALVHALQKLMDDKCLRDAYAAKAIEVRQRFSTQSTLRQWQRLFEGITMSRRTGIDMTSHAKEIANGRRFAFGKNWQRFIEQLDDSRIQAAQGSLKCMLDKSDLAGRSFLDVGSGSGLLSLAASKLGATVVSVDYDPYSLECTRALRARYSCDEDSWHVEPGSILDDDFVARLGKFDIVYSWGVLHHTGDMYRALSNVTSLVAGGGLLVVAIYNDQGRASKYWLKVKQGYNALPRPLRWLVVLPCFVRLWGPTTIRDVFRGVPFSTWRSYRENDARGMDPWRDVIDWVGGLPFEVAKPEEIFCFCRERHFELERLKTCAGGLGCNEYVFSRQGDSRRSAIK